MIHEHIVFGCVQIVAATLGFYLTGAFVAVIAGGELSTSEEVSKFARRFKVNYRTRRLMQDYFLSLEQLTTAIPKQDLFFKLSPSLTKSLLMDIHGSWMTRLPIYEFFQTHLHGGPLRKSLKEKVAQRRRSPFI